MSDDPVLIATPSQTVGPFFDFALTADASLGRMVDTTAEAERIRLCVRVTDGDGQPVSDAVVELWQVMDAKAGQAAVESGAIRPPGVARFGRLPTREDGTCEFETVRPVSMPDTPGRQQAAHINVCLFARGLLRQLYTRIYFAGDPALKDDPVLALVPEERRSTLLARPDGASGRWLFDVGLQGPQETVFFAA
jgi:protocatechuate 3,4-dioxygenase alpha subunit